MKNDKAQIAFGAIALTLAGAVVLNVGVNVVTGIAGALAPKPAPSAVTATAKPVAPAPEVTQDREATLKAALEAEASDAYDRINDPAANCSAVLNRCW